MKPLVFHPEAEAEYYAQQDYYESQQTGLGFDSHNGQPPITAF